MQDIILATMTALIVAGHLSAMFVEAHEKNDRPVMF